MLVIQNFEHTKKQIRKAKENGTMEGEQGLRAQLEYLKGYGCHKSDNEVKVEIGYDWSGFSIGWFRKVKGEYVFFMNGGLIYHSYSKQWSVHT